MSTGEHQITLARRDEPTSTGDWVYRAEGLKASVYINRRLFQPGQSPDSITLTAADGVFRVPGAHDPDILTRRIARLEHRAAAKRAHAAACLSSAHALGARADRLRGATG